MYGISCNLLRWLFLILCDNSNHCYLSSLSLLRGFFHRHVVAFSQTCVLKEDCNQFLYQSSKVKLSYVILDCYICYILFDCHILVIITAGFLGTILLIGNCPRGNYPRGGGDSPVTKNWKPENCPRKLRKGYINNIDFACERKRKVWNIPIVFLKVLLLLASIICYQ